MVNHSRSPRLNAKPSGMPPLPDEVVILKGGTKIEPGRKSVWFD